nr:U3 small nucleolar RNA-associated protein 4 homolog [Lytechinus pictus]
MSDFRVHHVKFFNYVPSGIQCLAYNQTDKLLAVGREDSSVEIWKTGEGRKWLQQKVIPGSKKRKVNSLVWVKGRLFSAGLQGDITEYDLHCLKPKKSVYYGNAFWCIAVNHAQTHIAAGCEDGYIRLYELTDELFYDRSLQMQQGRVVSLAWHISDEVIVTGSLDNIRIWNVNTGHATLRITTQRVQKHTEVVVWQVAILDDMTIISGDSVGRTQFWNGKHGTLLKSYTSHRASILALAVSQDQGRIFSAGVDPIITEFQLVQKASGSETRHWVRGKTIRDHSHDVRALVIAGDTLLSGGVDTLLAVNPVDIETAVGKPSKSAAQLRHRIRSFPHKPIVCLAPKARMLLLQYSHSLEVWKLGNTEACSDEDGKQLPLSEQPVKLLELKAKVGIEETFTPQGMEQIRCSTISSCGTWVAYSDVEKIRVYHITHNPMSINRVPTIPSNLHPAHHLVFTSDSSKLVSASGRSSGLQVLTVDGPDGVDCPQPLVQSVSVAEVQGPYTVLTVSRDGERVAVVGSEGKVAVLPLNSNKIKSVVLPHTKVHPCCLEFHPSNKQLAVAYTNRKIAEYDFTKHEYTPWSRAVHKQGLHQAWMVKTSVIHQMTFDPLNPDRLLVQDGTWLTVIDKSKVGFMSVFQFIYTWSTNSGLLLRWSNTT